MDIVKLVDFVKSGELFDKIDGEYGQIVSDFDFGNIDVPDGFVKIDHIGDVHKLDSSKTILFILDELLPENLLDYIEENTIDIGSFTILDLNFGLGGYGIKIGLSKLDLGDLIAREISVYEPMDLISLLDDLDSGCDINNVRKYIRVNNLDLPLNFVNNDVVDILSMSDHGLSGSAFTIVTTGTMLPEIVRIAHILNEHGLFVDVFILNKLNFGLDEKMEALISHNKNIMFVLDLFNSDKYEIYIKDKLKENNIRFIYPEYKKLTTILDEYKFEEVGFDAVGLVERLK